MSEQIKLSGKAAQALWDAGRRWDVGVYGFNMRTLVRPLLRRTYILVTDSPLTTPQAIAVGGVSPLVEVDRYHNRSARIRCNGGKWELYERDGQWVPAIYYPGNSGCNAWRLVAGDVRDGTDLDRVRASAKRASEQIDLEAMTDDTTNEQHMAALDEILAEDSLLTEEIDAVRWARDQVVELRRERDEARAVAERMAVIARDLQRNPCARHGVCSCPYQGCSEPTNLPWEDDHE